MVVLDQFTEKWSGMWEDSMKTDGMILLPFLLPEAVASPGWEMNPYSSHAEEAITIGITK